jgi:hypothetical protein
MANFSGNINLLGFKGAKVFTNLDAQHPNQLYVAIPVGYNDIQLSQDGRYANARVFMAETNDKFRQACIQRKQQSGDSMEGYMPPSHQMEVSFSPEFRQRALEAARKRLVSEHPEWTGADLEDPERNTDLRNAMYDAVRCRLGSMYCHQKQSNNQQAAAPANSQVASGAQSWQEGAPFPPQESDDLPF